MPAHFNPPPGWPIPAEWEPPPNWEPDPTWPAAPAGWQFWIDDAPTALAYSGETGSYPVAEPGSGVTGWATPDAPVGLGRNVGQDQHTGLSTANKRVVVASLTAAVVAVLALVGVLIVTVIRGHGHDTAEAVKPSSTHGSDSQWTNVPRTNVPTTSALIPSPATTAPPRKPSSNARPSGDLGLRTPISFPKCDGQGIVILGSLVEPSRYAIGVQQLLDAHPGAAYLRTDLSCHSLTQRTDQGNPIYTVYTLAGHTRAQLCAAVRAAGGNSYGKWLDNTTDPDHIVPC